MQPWQPTLLMVQHWLDRWCTSISDLPLPVILGLLLLPIVLATASRKIILVLICLIMVVAAGLIFIAPANAAIIIAIALYIGSVFASLTAIVTRWRRRDDLAILQMQVGDLLAAEQRRLMRNVGRKAETNDRSAG
jgi:hypothetical protein